MSTFFVNKYPIMVFMRDDLSNGSILPPGNIFVVDYIECGMVHLKPVKKDAGFTKHVENVYAVEFAFDKTDSID